jgi:hypothetical protein
MYSDGMEFSDWLSSPEHGGQVNLALFLLYTEVMQLSACDSLDARVWRTILGQLHYRMSIGSSQIPSDLRFADYEAFKHEIQPNLTVLLDTVVRRRKEVVLTTGNLVIMEAVQAPPQPPSPHPDEGPCSCSRILPILADIDYWCLEQLWKCCIRPCRRQESTTTTTTTPSATSIMPTKPGLTPPWACTDAQENRKKFLKTASKSLISEIGDKLSDTIQEDGNIDSSVLEFIEFKIVQISSALITFDNTSVNDKEAILRVAKSFSTELHELVVAEDVGSVAASSHATSLAVSIGKSPARRQSAGPVSTIVSRSAVRGQQPVEQSMMQSKEAAKTQRIQRLIVKTISVLNNFIESVTSNKQNLGDSKS